MSEARILLPPFTFFIEKFVQWSFGICEVFDFVGRQCFVENGDFVDSSGVFEMIKSHHEGFYVPCHLLWKRTLAPHALAIDIQCPFCIGFAAVKIGPRNRNVVASRWVAS